MSRYHYWQYLLNQEGQPISSTNISIYLAGSDTPVYIYDAESGGNSTNITPQTTTDKTGYFEFWIADDAETNGYPLGQKFKIKWNREGVVTGSIDYIDISPDISPVDETDNTSSEKDKLISNLLAYTWDTHTEHNVINDGYPIHGITFINITDDNTNYNKLISNKIAKDWEDHRIFNFTTYTSETTAASGAHSLAAANKNDTSIIFNKLVSNQLINDIYENLNNVASSVYSDSDAQNAVGNILKNKGNVSFTYSPSGFDSPYISASISANDIDHDSLLNYVANEHINHSTVEISAGSGLSGGGDISTSKTINLDASIADLNDAGLPNATSAGQLEIWNATNEQFENTTLTNGGNVTITNEDASITLSVPNDLTVMSNYDTDDLSEGISNLYYTDAKVDARLSGGTGISYSTGTINLDINSLTEATSADTTGDYLTIYNGQHQKITPDNLGISGGSSGGSGLPLLMPDDMSLDDTDIASSRGSGFSMIETIDFGSGADGSIWTTFHFPDTLDDTKDINLLTYYNLNGADDSKIVKLNTYYWSKGIGETPDSGIPNGTNTDDISTGIGENNAIRSVSLTTISPSATAVNDVIILKLQREGSNVDDTYTGTFQLLYVFPYQN